MTLSLEQEGRHCDTCICGKRAPVQADAHAGRHGNFVGPGTISWDEHCLAWGAYAHRHGGQQTAERIAERGGFSYGELMELLGAKPETWEPRR